MKSSNWRENCKNHLSDNELSIIKTYDKASQKIFNLKVPLYFKESIDFNNDNDPLLLQVLPVTDEKTIKIGYSNDPVGDLNSLKNKGIIHKYFGRVLLISTGTCAINCRYCFRRNFPYSQNNASAHHWKESVKYIKNNTDIHEVILSGGDPLMLSTKVLINLTEQLKDLPHIKTIRIHTRIPLVSPSRITDNFLNWLKDLPQKKVMVIHCNHANELTNLHKKIFKRIANTDTLLLNQSVLLKNINDNPDTLINLSHKLFESGVLPYYLNLLDKAKGTHHFKVKKSKAKSLHKILLQQLPGYLVPKLVEEILGKKNKSPLF